MTTKTIRHKSIKSGIAAALAAAGLVSIAHGIGHADGYSPGGAIWAGDWSSTTSRLADQATGERPVLTIRRTAAAADHFASGPVPHRDRLAD
jgi:hypothetical protein